MAIMRVMAERKPLSQFESLVQQVVEGSFNRLFGGRLHLLDVTTKLARAMEDSEAGGVFANRYVVSLNPADFSALGKEQPDLAVLLAEQVRQVARRSGRTLVGAPQVVLKQDRRLRLYQVRIVGRRERAVREETTRARANDEGYVVRLVRELDAFVVVEGQRHLALSKPVVTIGRRTDNDVVVESSFVSRQHAQLRFRYGRFVLHDLGSRAGVWVNGERVREWALRPGDVIRLADRVALIYGEGGVEKKGRVSRPGDDEGGTLAMPRVNR